MASCIELTRVIVHMGLSELGMHPQIYCNWIGKWWINCQIMELAIKHDKARKSLIYYRRLSHSKSSFLVDWCGLKIATFEYPMVPDVRFDMHRLHRLHPRSPRQRTASSGHFQLTVSTKLKGDNTWQVGKPLEGEWVTCFLPHGISIDFVKRPINPRISPDGSWLFPFNYLGLQLGDWEPSLVVAIRLIPWKSQGFPISIARQYHKVLDAGRRFTWNLQPSRWVKKKLKMCSFLLDKFESRDFQLISRTLKMLSTVMTCTVGTGSSFHQQSPQF